MIDSPTFYLKSPSEMEELFDDLPEAVKNTIKIAEKVNIEIPLAKVSLANFEAASNYTADEYLRKSCYEGIKKQETKITDEMNERIEYKLWVITEKGYSKYFL